MMNFDYLPDGGANYRTADGDVLDLIAFNFYGTHEDTTALLYDNNRDLALVAQPFAAGRLIYMPPRPPTEKPKPQIQLWE